VIGGKRGKNQILLAKVIQSLSRMGVSVSQLVSSSKEKTAQTKEGNSVERLFQKLKQVRRIFTPYEQWAKNNQAMLSLVSTVT
jgi:hypothetical protein